MVDNTKANTPIMCDLKVKKWLNLNHKKEKERVLKNISTQNQGLSFHFIEFLVYECELIGKRFLKIGESYTSKECLCLWN